MPAFPFLNLLPHPTTEAIVDTLFAFDDESLAVVVVVVVATLLVDAAVATLLLLLLLLLRLVEEAKARGRDAHCWARAAMVLR